MIPLHAMPATSHRHEMLATYHRHEMLAIYPHQETHAIYPHREIHATYLCGILGTLEPRRPDTWPRFHLKAQRVCSHP